MRNQSSETTNQLFAIVFSTPLGAMAVVESADGVVATLVGYQDIATLRDWIRRQYPGVCFRNHSPTADLLRRYASGENVVFDQVELDQRGLTPFRRTVTRACRNIRFGATSSYKELARKAGSPKAGRAVGSVMARNPWPIIVPCHRVVRADGQLGGYSCPIGLRMKQKLLHLESGKA